MNEYRRQAYLDALGVEQYLPRWRLALAPEPRACALPAAQSAARTTEPAGARAAPSGPAPVSDVLGSLGEAKAPPPEAPAPAQPPVEEATGAPAVERIAPFTLSIWRSSLPLLVLDAREPRSALPTDRLLRNLLGALGGSDPASIREEVLPWPLVDHPGMHLSAEDARKELHTWLEAELAARPVGRLLLMGENAARYWLPEGTDLEQARWREHRLESFDRPALMAPSLAELLREPLLKRRLWQALQPWLPLT